MPDFSALMLTIARESRRLSQEALAKKAGITQSAVSQIESGKTANPTEKVVGQLAGALDYKPTLFYAPLRFQQLPITFFRKRQIGAKDVAAIRARVNLYRLRIETLLRARDYHGPRLLHSDLMSEGVGANEAAKRLRVYWNVPPGPIANLTALVESFGIVVVPIDFGTNRVDGLSIYEPGDGLPPMIFVNHSLPADRWRMTIGHETGHIDLHHHLRVPPPLKDMEDEAFAYGTELMAPEAEIAGHLARVTMDRLAALKRHWRVSMGALLHRAERMGTVPERDARWMWIQLRRGGVEEPVSIANERPTFLRSLVDFHLNELGYSVRDLGDLLHLNSDELRADFGLTAPLKVA